ncbi:MAG TPA: CocE/NonD family hydrolase, partial [Thermoleophilaceae bacterium]
MVAVSLALAPAASAAPLDGLRQSCHSERSAGAHPVRYRICNGKVPSFDGTALDATLTTPARRPLRRRPLIVYLHGFLADKGEYLSQTRDGSSSYKTVHWNNIWFASRGYDVLNYSARGQGASDGQIGLASKNIEVRDTQYLTGLLADDGRIARVYPRRIGVIGSSYGGGQAWLLLTTKGKGARRYGSWLSPRGRPMRLGALVPGYTWTDLLAALLPGGGPRGVPLGVGKLTIVDGLVASANSKLPARTLGWVARLNAGEPYEDGDPVVADARRSLGDERSALYQDGFFRALKRSKGSQVPVLAGQGWTDPIFPVSEAVRMYDRLRAARRRFPIQLYLGDFEHLTALARVADLAYFHRLGNRLLDRALRHRGRRIKFDVRSAASRCDPAGFGPVVRASSFRRLARRTRVFELPGTRQAISPAPSPAEGVAVDPVVQSTQKGRGCLTTRSGPGPGVAAWSVSTGNGFTLRGMPRLELHFRTLAPDVELNSRLWDVDPGGTRTLVTRGAQRVLNPNRAG